MNTDPCKVLIGSAVRQKPQILAEFLKSLTWLDRSGLTTDCLFINNNDDEESTRLLTEFTLHGASVFIGSDKPTEAYHCTEETHFWHDGLIWKLAGYKDFILKFALDNNYTHVLMIDSDLVLHPQTLHQLLSTGKNIVSEIFWTEWMPDSGELPQVWMAGQYSFHAGGSQVPEEQKSQQATHIISQLRAPGLYEVGGLGACTLISVAAIAKGVNYQKIKNVDYWGEDRHFCIRAVVLGFGLYVDTHYPAFHIYRESSLPKLAEYKQKNNSNSPPVTTKENPPCIISHGGNIWQRKPEGNKVTLSMIVRNESQRYLRQVLEHAKQYINEAVIIDDASTDNTAKLCQDILAGIPLKIITREHSGFSNEIDLRKQQWQETVKTNPDWILALDADEIFEDKVTLQIKSILNQTEYDIISFRLYDFWDENHYREDQFWCAHKFYRPFLLRYIPTFNYIWKETPVHCGRLPSNITELKGATSPLRVKHFGWADPKDRESKYARYIKSDPDGKYGILQQYTSIMDPHPNLIRWEE